MDSQVDETKVLSDRELVLQFESLGDNCELGLLQRRVGEEPLGLLRMAGMPLPDLITALDAGFEGNADPAQMRISIANGEYLVQLNRFSINYHTDVRVGQADPGELLRRQTNVVRFLTEKLISDLRDPGKILVFRQNEPLLADDLLKLRIALSKYGPSVLLVVLEAGPDDVAGTVFSVSQHLMVGYIRRFAPRSHVPDLEVSEWVQLLRRAHRLAMIQQGTWRQPSGATLLFGRDGSARGAMGYGWSIPETGFTWSMGERSQLFLDHPGDAASFRLEIDGIPFEAPPLLPRQRLDVLIGNVLVHSFDPVPRGMFACEVPGDLVSGQGTIELVLNHPGAPSPMLVSGHNDSRRLGIAVRRVSLLPRHVD